MVYVTKVQKEEIFVPNLGSLAIIFSSLYTVMETVLEKHTDKSALLKEKFSYSSCDLNASLSILFRDLFKLFRYVVYAFENEGYS